MSNPKIEFELHGHKFQRDENDRYSLTDLYKAAGSPKSKDPKFWLRFPGTQSLLKIVTKEQEKKTTQAQEAIDTTCQQEDLFVKPKNHDLDAPKGQNTRGDLKSPRLFPTLVKVMRGGRVGGGNTYAHWKIYLGYAQYLSSELHSAILEVFGRWYAGDIALAEDIYKRSSKESQEWLEKRIKGKADRKLLTDTLQRHDVEGKGYAMCTNSLYISAVGKDAKAIEKEQEQRAVELFKQKIPATKAGIRDRMTIEQLGCISAAEFIASVRIERKNVRGNAPCANECGKAGADIRKLLDG